MKQMNDSTYKILIMISFMFAIQTPFLNGMFRQKQIPQQNKTFTTRVREWLRSFYPKQTVIQEIEKKRRGIGKVTLQAQNGPVSVSEDLLKQSKTISNMLSDLGFESLTELTMPINIEKFSMDTIKSCMELLRLYQNDLYAMRTEISYYSLEKFIDVANCAEYLDVPEPVQKAINDSFFLLLNTIPLENVINTLKNTSLKFLDGPMQAIAIGLKRELRNTEIKQKVDRFRSSRLKATVACFRPKTKTLIYADQINGPAAKTIQANGSIIDEDIRFDKEHHWSITSIAFNNDGKMMVTSSVGVGNTLIVWTWKDDGTVTPEYLDTSAMKNAVMSPNGKFIAIFSASNEHLNIWTLENEKFVKKETSYQCKPLSFSFDNEMLACADEEGNCVVFNFPSMDIFTKIKGQLGGFGPYKQCGVFHPYNKKFFTTGADAKSIVVYDFSKQGSNFETVLFLKHRPIIMEIDSTGDLLAVGNPEGVSLIDLHKKTEIINLPMMSPKHLSFSTHGEDLICSDMLDTSLYNLTSMVFQNAVNDLNKLSTIPLVLLSKLVSLKEPLSEGEKNQLIPLLNSISSRVKKLLSYLKLIELPIIPEPEAQPVIQKQLLKALPASQEIAPQSTREQSLLEKEKEDMRRYFTGPHLQSKEARIKSIQELKPIYEMQTDYRGKIRLEAFKQVVKEMGLGDLL